MTIKDKLHIGKAVKLVYKGREFAGAIHAIKHEFKKVDLIFSDGLIYRSIQYSSLNNKKFFTLSDDMISQCEITNWERLHQVIPRIFFTDVIFTENVYVRHMGFTDRTLRYCAASSEQEAEEKVTEFYNAKFEADCERVRVDRVVVRPAINPFKCGYAFPEEIVNGECIQF